jgi:hypothetical protein
VVEHDLAKVGVEGSNPFARSRIFLDLAKFDEGPLSQRAFRFVERRRALRDGSDGCRRPTSVQPHRLAGMKTCSSSLHRGKIVVIHGWISRMPQCSTPKRKNRLK